MGFRFLRLERVLGYKQFNKETHTEYPKVSAFRLEERVYKN